MPCTKTKKRQRRGRARRQQRAKGKPPHNVAPVQDGWPDPDSSDADDIDTPDSTPEGSVADDEDGDAIQFSEDEHGIRVLDQRDALVARKDLGTPLGSPMADGSVGGESTCPIEDNDHHPTSRGRSDLTDAESPHHSAAEPDADDTGPASRQVQQCPLRAQPLSACSASHDEETDTSRAWQQAAAAETEMTAASADTCENNGSPASLPMEQYSSRDHPPFAVLARHGEATDTPSVLQEAAAEPGASPAFAAILADDGAASPPRPKCHPPEPRTPVACSASRGEVTVTVSMHQAVTENTGYADTFKNRMCPLDHDCPGSTLCRALSSTDTPLCDHAADIALIADTVFTSDLHSAPETSTDGPSEKHRCRRGVNLNLAVDPQRCVTPYLRAWLAGLRSSNDAGSATSETGECAEDVATGSSPDKDVHVERAASLINAELEEELMPSEADHDRPHAADTGRATDRPATEFEPRLLTGLYVNAYTSGAAPPASTHDGIHALIQQSEDGQHQRHIGSRSSSVPPREAHAWA